MRGCTRLMACWIVAVQVATVVAQPAEELTAGLGRLLVGHWPKVESATVIEAAELPGWGESDFSIALWLRCSEPSRQLPGDILSQYDHRARRGFHLSLKSNSGVTSNQANWRHLQFGIDDDRGSGWQDCGRPGESLFAFALAVHEGQLFAGTCEPGVDQAGRVYRLGGEGQWMDCGPLDGANSVTALAVHQGQLYAGTGKYRTAGSALEESANPIPGGSIFRYAGDQRWMACGRLPDRQAVGGLAVYDGRLYASSLYQPAGFFRYEGDDRWLELPVPTEVDGAGVAQPRRVVSLGVHGGFLYASSYDGGRVHRYDGQAWTDCGQVGDNTQTYGFTVHEGQLLVSTWPSGRVYRFEQPGDWTDLGQLGDELEVMGMVVHNGRLLAGTLPLAQVYAYDGPGQWSLLARLDQTPDVKYRRAWTMAEHDGKLYCSTLPSGRILAYAQGYQISWEHGLSSDWHHLVATRSGSRLALYIDGRPVADRAWPSEPTCDLTSTAPLRIGDGVNGPWAGQLADVRLYLRLLEISEIQALSERRP